MLTRFSQSLLRPGGGWAQPFCRAFELRCHFVVKENPFCRMGGWSSYKMSGSDPTGVIGRGIFWCHLQVKTSQQKSVKIIVFIFNIMIYIHLSYDDPDDICVLFLSFAGTTRRRFARVLRYWVPSFVKEKRFHNWLTEAGINTHLPSKMLGKCFEK